ncbi:uncharacterized protein LOC144146528 isoform X4 [Haemaphysalis longicornis]
MANPREIGQEELHNRLKKLREQKEIITTVIEDLVRRVELAASRAANVTSISEFLCHFVTATGSMDRLYMKMFQAHVLLTQEDVFAVSPDYLRAPMAITYSFQDFNDQIYAQRAALEAPGSLPSISRPPSVASPHLSVCDEMLGSRSVQSLPPQSEPQAVALSLNSPGYAAPGGRQPVSAPPGAPEPVMEGGPGTQPLLASQQPLGWRDCEPQQDFTVPPAHSLQPAMAAGPGTRSLFAASQQPLGYRNGEPQQEFMVPPALSMESGPGTRPLLPASQQPLGYRSCEPQQEFMVPSARSLQSVMEGGPGTRPLLPASQQPLGYHNGEPQQESMVPPVAVGTGHVPVAKLPSPTLGYESPAAQLMSGHGAFPELSSPLPPVHKSPKAPFVSGPSALPEMLSPPTQEYMKSGTQFVSGSGRLPEFSMPPPPYTSTGAQLATEPKLTTAQTDRAPASATKHTGPMAPPAGGAEAGRVEMSSCSATPRAEAPERAGPTAEGVAPPVQSASSAPQKPAEGAIKEDVRDRGDACSLLAEADRVSNNNCSQPQGEGKPAGKKATVSVPPGFTALHRQLPRIVTDMKAFLPDKQQQHLESVMAGSVKSQSPSDYERFTIPPADTKVIGTTQKVVLSFYKSPSEFWLQLESSGKVLDGLLNELGAYYKSSTAHQQFEAKVGMHCVARYAVDNCWYRVQILELLPDHAKVSYVDFGNCDRVPLTELCVLAKQFASLPVQAFTCSIKGMVVSFPLQLFDAGPNRKWPLSTVRVFRDMVVKDDLRLEAKFYLWDRMSGRFIVDVLGRTGDGPVANLSAEFITICTMEPLKAVQVPSCGLERVGPAAQQPPAEGAPAAGEPLDSGTPAIGPPGEQGAAACRDGTVSVPTSASAEAVAPACAPAPQATAISAAGPPPASTPLASEPPVVVPEVSKPAAARSPPRPPGAVPPAGGPSSGGAVARLPRKPLPPGVAPAALPPGPVPQHLPPPGAVHLPLPTIPPTSIPDGGSFSFVLSVIFSPADFYGQILTGNSTPGVMEELQQQLNHKGSTSSPPPVALVTKGTFWICAHPADKNYYRTLVLETGNINTGWRARVLYVDYGNRGLVELDNLRPLPEYLAKLPACAHRMSLALVNPFQGSKWGEAAKALFLNETGFNTVLFAEKKSQHQTGLETVAEVVLWNKNGPTPVNINILLVEKKLAQLKSP